MLQTQDPWDSLNNPQMPKSELWGKVDLRAAKVGLVKGVGKEAYDPAKHKRAWTSVEIFIDPLPELGIDNLNICTRNLLAESREWSGIVLASLRELGVEDVRAAHGKYARVEQVATGDTYIKDGVTKEKTTFRFVALYADEAACRAAYVAENGEPAAAGPVAPVPNQGAAAFSNGRETALKFMKPIVENSWRAANGNFEEAHKLAAQKIATIPMVAQYFDAQSPELNELLMQMAVA